MINVRNLEMFFFFSQLYVFHLIKPGASTELSCFNRSGKIDLTDRYRQGSRGVQWPFPALFLREAAEAPLSAPRTGAGAAFSPRQGRVASWGSGHQDLVAGLEQPRVMTCGNLCVEFRVPDSKYLHQWPLLWPLFLWRALDLQKGVGFTDFKWKQRSVYLQGSQGTNKQVLFLWAELSKE